MQFISDIYLFLFFSRHIHITILILEAFLSGFLLEVYSDLGIYSVY
jgi:hypothetical protein